MHDTLHDIPNYSVLVGDALVHFKGNGETYNGALLSPSHQAMRVVGIDLLDKVLPSLV